MHVGLQLFLIVFDNLDIVGIAFVTDSCYQWLTYGTQLTYRTVPLEGTVRQKKPRIKYKDIQAAAIAPRPPSYPPWMPQRAQQDACISNAPLVYDETAVQAHEEMIFNKWKVRENEHTLRKYLVASGSRGAWNAFVAGEARRLRDAGRSVSDPGIDNLVRQCPNGSSAQGTISTHGKS